MRSDLFTKNWGQFLQDFWVKRISQVFSYKKWTLIKNSNGFRKWKYYYLLQSIINSLHMFSTNIRNYNIYHVVLFSLKKPFVFINYSLPTITFQVQVVQKKIMMIAKILCDKTQKRIFYVYWRFYIYLAAYCEYWI